MPCLPDQEQTDQRDKHPMAIIFAADPVAEQKGRLSAYRYPSKTMANTALRLIKSLLLIRNAQMMWKFDLHDRQ